MTGYPGALTKVYADADARRRRRGPPWAEDLAAPIPFIGRWYGDGPGMPRVLAYASAEHLSAAEKDGASPQFATALAAQWHPAREHGTGTFVSSGGALP